MMALFRKRMTQDSVEGFTLVVPRGDPRALQFLIHCNFFEIVFEKFLHREKFNDLLNILKC